MRNPTLLRSSIVFACVVPLALTLAGCATPQQAATETIIGSVSKEPAYATYTTIGIAIERNTYGPYEDNKDRYCEEAVEGFGLSGLDVKITDADGGTVGLAPLTFDADATEHQGGYLKCVWSFTVDDFESDSKFFTVEIDGVPGAQDFTRDELLAGPTLSVTDTSQQ